MRWMKRPLGVGVFLAAVSAAAWAADEKKADSPDAKPAAEAAAGEIAPWIKQLDADKFAERQAAGEQLFAAGKSAIPALTEAALGDSLEVTVRSIDLLQRFLDSEDKALQEAAKAGLEKIAQSDKSNAARRAKQVLEPEKDQQPQGPLGGMNVGRVQIQIGGLNPGGGMNVKRVNVMDLNGVKKIEAEDGGRKINITKNADESIEMEITEKVQGKDVTKKFEAKNPDDLRKKSRAAYETYKEFAEGNNALGGGLLPLNLGGGLLPGAMPGLPAQLGNLPRVRIAGPAGGIGLADELGETLKNWRNSLKSIAEDLAAEKLSPEEKKEIKTQIRDLKKQLDALERRLQKTAEKPST
ncbi:MAG: hypothetical protein IT426_16500 [Pirellulales bacterium]|nr:hypothetical protein [Pirellulales bacterium]